MHQNTAPTVPLGARLLVVSGWMGSGKDTVAAELWKRLGFAAVEHMSFATCLKDDVDLFIDWLRSLDLSVSDNEAATVLAADQGMSMSHSQEIVSLLRPRCFDLGFNSRVRTPETRRVLQVYGTDVRRSQDADYWVRPAMSSALASLEADPTKGVYFTDGRFPNEIDAPRAATGLAVRIDVTRETQLRRLEARNPGVPVDLAALEHESETALNDYDRFDVRVSNDGSLEDTIASALEQIRALAPLAA